MFKTNILYMRRQREVERKGVVYSPTLVQIPIELKQRAKLYGINISVICNEALEKKLLEIELMVDHESGSDTITETNA